VDVTDRKRAEDALRSSSRRLSLAISATSDAVWERNYQTGETYYSPRWFEMLAVPQRDMTFADWKSLCHPDDLEPALSRIDAMLTEPGSVGYEVELRMRRGDGTWAWLLERGNAVERDASGRPVLVAGTSTDVTQRKEAEVRRRELETRLAQAHRMESMGRLAGGIAHDFNNLLTVINGYSDLLLYTVKLDAAASEMLADIRNAGERASALTRQLLTFSRHQVVDPDVLELNVVVGDTERMLQRLIGEHIQVNRSLSTRPLWVRADAGQLGQVIVNLVVNARDAMPDGGTLTVSTSHVTLDEQSAPGMGPEARPGDYALLSMTDTGTGILPELLELVFEPFFTTKGPGKGTGLGLTTVHGIVRQSRGFLRVRSQPGAGSTFEVYLPIAEEPAPSSSVSAEPSPGTPAKRTVLMAEDETAVRDVAEVMLRRVGYEVLSAANAEEALQVAATHTGPIDLLLTDVIMPGMNGRQLAERLLTERPGLRVLYMSGYTDDAHVQHVVLNTDASYLQKPFDAETLSRKVRQAFEVAPPSPM
jgi:PAS domain S-box-containing protein